MCQTAYRQYLAEFVYDKIWRELSQKDRKVLYGIVNAGDARIKTIKEELHMTDNEWSPYRQRLIRKGIAGGSDRGYLRLTLPMFDEFVKEKAQFEQYR